MIGNPKRKIRFVLFTVEPEGPENPRLDEGTPSEGLTVSLGVHEVDGSEVLADGPSCTEVAVPVRPLSPRGSGPCLRLPRRLLLRRRKAPRVVDTEHILSGPGVNAGRVPREGRSTRGEGKSPTLRLV